MTGAALQMAWIMIMAHASVVDTAETIWLSPGEEPKSLRDSGVYGCWVFVPNDADTHVEVAGKRLDIAAARNRERRDTPGWRKAGELSLTAGPVEVLFGTGVALAVLSRVPDFDPARVYADMCVLPPGALARDLRLESVRDTGTVFTMPRYETRDAWERTAALLRLRLQLACGLFPMPEKTPLNARVFDKVVYEDYSVEKVHFEAWPGFLVTGNLYRPLGGGPFPGVLNPHGHWTAGRLEDSETCSVAARCITLARMGAVAFSYDMVGYVDSRQLPHNWGGAREKLWGVHTFAAQLWSGVRAVDFLQELPDVDPARIGCTGASGGGTQTFALTALDDRIRVAAPVTMVSATMQGGCLCENAPLIRMEHSNVEIAALAAPRPLLLVSATGDWTRETPRLEYPAIREIYRLYDAEALLENAHLDFDHNYNRPSREAMYRFFGRHLLQSEAIPETEPPYVKPPDDVLRVFPGDQPPPGYPVGDALIASFVERAAAERDRTIPRDKTEAAQFRQRFSGVFSALLNARSPAANDLHGIRHAMETRDDHVLEKWIIGRKRERDAIPLLLYRGREATPQDSVVIVHGKGKAMLADPNLGGPGPLVRNLLDHGKAVLTLDVFLVGEHRAAADGACSPAEPGEFHDTFHPTETGHRVQDVLTALSWLRARRDLTGTVDVIGLERGGVWCLLASAIDAHIRRLAADLNQTDFTSDDVWMEQYYVPGIRRIGDLTAATACSKADSLIFVNALPHAELQALGVPMQNRPWTDAEWAASVSAAAAPAS